MGSGVLRVVPSEGLVLSRAVIWGTHIPKKMRQALAATTASLGLNTALGMCQGREEDSVADPGGSMLRQCLCCFLLEAGDEAEEREGAAQWWG